MRSGWYHSSRTQPKIVSTGQIATACCVPAARVRKWLSESGLSHVPGQENLVYAGDAIVFFLDNGMPVPATLLPPNTRKVLFIADDEGECRQKEERIELICRVLSDHHNILARTSVSGRQADLNILTFAPDAVIIFLSSYNQSMANTFELLAGVEGKLILFVDDLTLQSMERRRIFLPADLICDESRPIEQLAPHLLLLLAA